MSCRSGFKMKIWFESQTLKFNIEIILGYECSCRSGFRINPDDPSMCNDIDECSESYPCSQTCLNTPGSYKCSCLPGYLPLDQDPTRCKADSTEEFLILFTSRYINAIFIWPLLRSMYHYFGSGVSIMGLQN